MRRARASGRGARACKWVDGVIEDVPYEVTDAFTDELFAKYGVDFVVHGDDPCLAPDGWTRTRIRNAWGNIERLSARRG